MITGIAFDAPELVAAIAEAASEARPLRATVATAVSGIVEDPPHELMVTVSFRDREQLRAFADVAAADLIVTEDHVVRGSDWLVNRWDRGPVLKHVAVAKRAEGLTLAQMLAAWGNHGGSVQRPGKHAVAIPERERGLAYVQHHPRVEGDHEWRYDAVTEVWFDDLDALRARADWFAHGPGSGPQALFRESRFGAFRETALI